MSLTVVVSRNVPDRYRGFLSSAMLEVSPGVYVSPKMSRGVRERVWQVCCEWSSVLPAAAGITMLWRNTAAPGGLSIEVLGAAKTALVDHDGFWLDHQDLTAAHRKQLHLTGPDPPATLSDK